MNLPTAAASRGRRWAESAFNEQPTHFGRLDSKFTLAKDTPTTGLAGHFSSAQFQLDPITLLDHHLMPLQTPLHRLRIIEDLLQLLEIPPLRLHDGEIHQHPHGGVEDQEDRVRLPPDVLQRDGRRVRVDEAGEPGHQALEGHALGADVVAEDFRRVQGLEGGPGEAPEDAVEEDHGDEGVARAGGDVAGGERRDHVDGDVGQGGEEEAPEEEGSAPEGVDGEGAGDAGEEGEDGVEGVEEELLAR